MKKTLLLLLAAMFSLTGCGNSDNPGTPSNPGTHEESGGEQEHQQEEEHKEDEKEYSTLLKWVIANEQIKSVCIALKEERLNYESNALKPHPYTFYESVGADLPMIRSNFYSAYTQAYVLDNEPNNVYMLTYFEDENQYLHEYHLRYTLTDKEMEEYVLMHTQRWFEVFFMNDAISATRQPTILSYCKTSKEAHNGVNTALHGLSTTKKLVGDYGTEILFREFNQETQKFSIFIFPNVGLGQPQKLVVRYKLGRLYLKCNAQEMKVINEAYCGPTLYQNFLIDGEIFDRDHLENYAEEVTWYTSQHADVYLKGDSYVLYNLLFPNESY
ncbi:MAG: hypothetical protein MJ245_07310 [Clostridia bacterium]|nr:hypothetical protein [Clostridia bacterium]